MFIEAVKTKPFIYSMATIKNAPVVCSFLIIPHRELKNLVRTLIILSENRFLSDFEIVDIDIVNSKTKYIPFDLYKGKWTYPHEEIINKTKEILLRIK
jgi:ribosomal protein S8